MITDVFYLRPSEIEELDKYVEKYTNFSSFSDLISPANNFKPVFYFDQTLPNFAKREIDVIIEAYDNHMRKNNDPRRIYKT